MNISTESRSVTTPRGPSRSSGAFDSPFWASLAQELVITAAHSVVICGALGLTLYSLDPSRSSSKSSKKYEKQVKRKFVENGRNPLSLTSHETIIAMDLVYPREIRTTFGDIGGLEEQKREIYDLICLPLKNINIFDPKSELLRPPKGILLYGSPGTGKTLTAKAIAKESGAAFVNLKVSTLLDKWFGESEKLVRATFSLAHKLSPCVIFVDEIDSFMRKRGSGTDHQAMSNMKNEFMSLWDGLNTFVASKSGKKLHSVPFFVKLRTAFGFDTVYDRKVTKDVELKNELEEKRKQFGVIVIGATNRPGDIDQAVLRRMARVFHFDLPNGTQRFQILQLLLKNENLSLELSSGLRKLGEALEGYSGSDLKELCRAAAVLPLKEYSRRLREGETDVRIRKLQVADFHAAVQKVKPTGVEANKFQDDLRAKEGANSDAAAIQNFFKMLLMSANNGNKVG
eukprot:snap_masked-scaffold_6-processed-gene-7.24-mRNA-1 protein AED:0.01 eAED:0.01 QI:0/-1/0/1/-1/1/1/0/455